MSIDKNKLFRASSFPIVKFINPLETPKSNPQLIKNEVNKVLFISPFILYPE